MTLEAKLKVIRKKLEDDDNFRRSEASVSQGIVLPILRELNWDTDNTRVVRPENITVGKDRADFALYDDSDNRKVFIEVKRLGGVEENAEKAEEQIMRYAHSKDNKARIAVLTDGGTWSLYLPEEGGLGYKGKRVFKLDILKQLSQESSEVLQRYLEESRVVSDKALETARVIFFLKKYREGSDRVGSDRVLEWNKVNDAIAKFESARNFLVDALQEDIKPKPAQNNMAQDVVDYFHSLLREKISQPSSGATAPRPQLESGERVPARLSSGASERKQLVHRPVRQVSAPPSSGASGSSRSGKLVILGESHFCRNQNHATEIVFKKLQEKAPGFLQRFYEHPENQKNKYKGRRGEYRYLGRSYRQLFGDNVKTPRSFVNIGNRWVVSADYNWEKKKEIIQLAAEVAGLEFGKDIILNFDD